MGSGEFLWSMTIKPFGDVIGSYWCVVYRHDIGERHPLMTQVMCIEGDVYWAIREVQSLVDWREWHNCVCVATAPNKSHNRSVLCWHVFDVSIAYIAISPGLTRWPGFKSRPTPMDFFWVFFWLLVVPNPPKTVGPKQKGQRLGVVTKRLRACLGFDSRNRNFTGTAGHWHSSRYRVCEPRLFAMPPTDSGARVTMVTWSGSSSLVFNFACQLCFVRF